MENRFWILYVLCVFHHFVLVPSSSFFGFCLHSRSLVFILLSEDLSSDFLSREWTALACSLVVRRSASFLNFLF
jgi:hypothetical protein